LSNAVQTIADEIRQRGVIPFARFMELALYCPLCGYYEQEADKIGRCGDYFTSVSVGSLFGELLAFQFAAWLAELGVGAGACERGDFQIVEAGAHDGRLARDILGWLSEHRPRVFAAVEYWIVEPSPRREQWQRETLHAFAGKLRWFADFETISGSGWGENRPNQVAQCSPEPECARPRAQQRLGMPSGLLRPRTGELQEIHGQGPPNQGSRFAPSNRAEVPFGVPALAGSATDLRDTPNQPKPGLQTRGDHGEGGGSRSASCLSRLNGIIFSNELLDALPVRRMGWDAQAKAWFEWGVTLDGCRFAWTKLREGEAAPKALTALLNDAGLDPPPDLLAVLPDEFTVEICPTATGWWRDAACLLQRGRLLTFDYGLEAEEFFAPHRQHGTLRAYRRHHVTDNVLADPGRQDLTAHVNFTALRSAGESCGLSTDSLTTQAQFLAAVAESAWRQPERFGNWAPHRLRQFQTLAHPEHLGRSFRVLVQSRPAQRRRRLQFVVQHR
jgi:SAM-dependent MidA family methyltransferase